MNVAKIEYGIVQELKKEEEKIWSELQLELAMSCNFASLKDLISLKKKTIQELETLKNMVVKNNLAKDKIEFMEMCIEEIEDDSVESAMEWALAARGNAATKCAQKAMAKKAKARVLKRKSKKGRPKKIEKRPIKIESFEEEEDDDLMGTDI